MSKIGKKIITIPDGVEVKISSEEGGTLVEIKGPNGLLNHTLPQGFEAVLEGRNLRITPVRFSKRTSALWGTTRALIANLILGVKQGFRRELEIEGIGFRAQVQGQDLVLSLGFSHPVNFKIPEGIDVSVEKNVITVSGISKERVGQAAAQIRALKKPEPYKGKGIRYLGEIIRRKAGKKVAGPAS